MWIGRFLKSLWVVCVWSLWERVWDQRNFWHLYLGQLQYWGVQRGHHSKAYFYNGLLLLHDWNLGCVMYLGNVLSIVQVFNRRVDQMDMWKNVMYIPNCLSGAIIKPRARSIPTWRQIQRILPFWNDDLTWKPCLRMQREDRGLLGNVTKYLLSQDPHCQWSVAVHIVVLMKCVAVLIFPLGI